MLVRVRYCVFQTIFLPEKPYYISNIWISVPPIIHHELVTKNDLSFQTQYNNKKNSTHSEATKTKWCRLYPSLTQIEMTMHAPALVQQFTHLVHPNRSHRLSYLLRKIADMTKKYNKRKQTGTRKNEQTIYATRHFSCQKSNGFTVDLPRSNCLLCLVGHAVIPLAAAASSLVS